jgi:hypothetical protein
MSRHGMTTMVVSLLLATSVSAGDYPLDHHHARTRFVRQRTARLLPRTRRFVRPGARLLQRLV